MTAQLDSFEQAAMRETRCIKSFDTRQQEKCRAPSSIGAEQVIWKLLLP